MKKKLQLFLFFCFLSLNVISQENYIANKYKSYFEDTREITHLHLNKTSFLEGEEIWFSAYVLEQNSKKPHPTTSNLYVSLFDDQGNLAKQHLVKIKDGSGNSSFLIDSTFTKNEYYIKASSNWMQNFKDDNAFVQRIKIVRDKKSTNTVNENDFYDFQVFAEGGHLVADVYSRVGILIKNKNNKGEFIDNGVLKNKETDEVITQFLTNNFGLGSLYFIPKAKENYVLEATLKNGVTITKELPIIKEKGIGIQVKNPNAKFLEITLATNNKTLSSIKNKEFKVWIHNTNSFYQRNISFNGDNTANTLFVKNSLLPAGVNIITVFNENNTPILERLIFNYNKNLFTKPNFDKVAIENDSLSISISNPTNKTLQLSASVLPSDTKAYKPNNSIYSSFLLKPYIKGDIENPNFYFKNITRKSLEDLDLLFITQGWSKYNWNDIFNNTPQKNFEFENGLDVTMNFNQKIGKNQNIVIFSEQNNLIRTLKRDEVPLKLKNSFIKKGSEINFALKYGTDVLKIVPSLSYSNFKLNDKISLKDYKYVSQNNQLELSNFGAISPTAEMLDTVVINSKVKKWDNEVRGFATSIRLQKGEDIIEPSGLLTRYIYITWLKYRSSQRPLARIYLNNVLVRGEWEIADITMDEIRGLGVTASLFGFYREMHVYTYSDRELSKQKPKNLVEMKFPVGFAISKEYYQPQYPSYTASTFKNYGAIHWFPNISIPPNSTKTITTNKYLQDEFRVFIEGFTEDGKLYMEEKVVN